MLKLPYSAGRNCVIESLGEVRSTPHFWNVKGTSHPYPVGFRGKTLHFGKSFDFWIEEDGARPLFVVQDHETGRRFTGRSATAPWTTVCIAYSGTGNARASGPLVRFRLLLRFFSLLKKILIPLFRCLVLVIGTYSVH
jgi:hypothetical protein